MNKWLTTIFACLLGASLWGQAHKSFHDTFPLDSVKTIHLDLYGEPTVQSWPGNNIMIETKIKLYDASDVILDHFAEAGRYKVEAQEEDGILRLVSLDKERKTIKTKKGECFEEVNTIVYMPDTFKEVGANHYQCSSEEHKDD